MFENRFLKSPVIGCVETNMEQVGKFKKETEVATRGTGLGSDCTLHSMLTRVHRVQEIPKWRSRRTKHLSRIPFLCSYHWPHPTPSVRQPLVKQEYDFLLELRSRCLQAFWNPDQSPTVELMTCQGWIVITAALRQAWRVVAIISPLRSFPQSLFAPCDQ